MIPARLVWLIISVLAALAVIGAAVLHLLPASVLLNWAIAFAGGTALAVLAIALYRVRLELQSSRRALNLAQAELGFARQVQQALLPASFPGNSGLEFQAVCIPARGISGDYFDVFELSDERVGIAIADISGKGISAAILMASLQALLRSVTDNEPDPREVCHKLNHHFYRMTEPSRFATFFYAEWCARSRTLKFVNAGHNLPIAIGSCEQVDWRSGGFPMGMFPASRFELGEVCLEPGDVLLLYSDGITDLGESQGRNFGEARLQQVLAQNCNLALEELQLKILNELEVWSNQEPEDDMTMVLIKTR